MIGIDTLRIKLIEYEVSNTATLLLNTDFTLFGEDKSQFLFRTREGEGVNCKKAYLNRELFNFEILRGLNGTNAFIHFSIPKVSSKENNYKLVDKDYSYKSLKEIESSLKSEGIRAKLSEGKVSRIDICKNIVTDCGYREYDNVLKNLQMKRGIKKEFGKKVDSHLWKNTQQEICIYDKYSEMYFNRKETKDIPVNTMRCEIRLMRTRKVADELSFENVEDMFDRYGELEDYYRDKLKDNIFKYNVEEFDVLLKNQVVSRLNYFRNHYRRNWLNEFIKCFGMVQIEKIIGMKVLEEALKEVGCKRNSFHYFRKNYNKKIFENSLFDININPAELYNELKYKFCEAA